ncbi:MAG: hypothetical protein RR128_09475 [Clostridium sp.]
MNVITTQNTPIFNHTGHIAMWNYVIDVLSSITEETIRNTSVSVVYGDWNHNYDRNSGLPKYISLLETEFLCKNNFSNIKYNSCFACKYAYEVWNQNGRIGDNCNCCPFNGIKPELGCMNGIYDRCCDSYIWKLGHLFSNEKLQVSYIERFLSDLPEIITKAESIRDWTVKSGVETK